MLSLGEKLRLDPLLKKPQPERRDSVPPSGSPSPRGETAPSCTALSEGGGLVSLGLLSPGTSGHIWSVPGITANRPGKPQQLQLSVISCIVPPRVTQPKENHSSPAKLERKQKGRVRSEKGSHGPSLAAAGPGPSQRCSRRQRQWRGSGPHRARRTPSPQEAPRQGWPSSPTRPGARGQGAAVEI